MNPPQTFFASVNIAYISLWSLFSGLYLEVQIVMFIYQMMVHLEANRP